jgi:hypothetical protein
MSHSSAYGIIKIGGKMNHQTIYDTAFTVVVSYRREFISLPQGGKDFRSEYRRRKLCEFSFAITLKYICQHKYKFQ